MHVCLFALSTLIALVSAANPVVTVNTTVGEYITKQCGHVNTYGVMGVSRQLLMEVDCERKDTFVDFTGTPGMDFSGSGVFPVGQEVLLEKLIIAQRNRSTTLKFDSITRSFVQQFCLFEWKRLGDCGQTNPVASPGESNHNGGLAVDVIDWEGWSPYLLAAGLHTLSDDKPHFYSDGPNIKAMSIKAFQRLWNLNYPDDQITVDGLYNDQNGETRSRLLKTPAMGFRLGSTCNLSPPVKPLTEVDQPKSVWREFKTLFVILIIVTMLLVVLVAGKCYGVLCIGQPQGQGQQAGRNSKFETLDQRFQPLN